jgi:hypothetical protein
LKVARCVTTNNAVMPPVRIIVLDARLLRLFGFFVFAHCLTA